MICPTCQRETVTYSELDAALGAVEKCGHLDCKAPMHRPAPLPPRAQPVAAVGAVAHPPPMAEYNGPRTHASSGVTGASLIDMMRARLAVVEAKLTEMHALVAEEALLRRMLGAAEPDKN